MFKLQSGVGRLSWRSLLPLLSVIAAGFGVFVWRLGSLTPGFSPAEIKYKIASDRINAIVQNPINAPHKLFTYGLERLAPHQAISLRFGSVIFALVFCFCFYKLAVSWFGRAIGLFASLIFATLPLLVIDARQVSPDIMYFSPVVFMWLYVWLMKPQSSKSLVWLIILLAIGLFIYTPGFLLLLILTFGIARKRVLSAISSVPPLISIIGLLWIAANAGLVVYAGLKHLSILKAVFLVPTHISSAVDLLQNIGWMAASLFVRTGSNNPLILGHLPIFSLLLAALLVFGVYAMQGAARAKTLTLGFFVVYAVLAAGINNNTVILALAVPALCIFVAAGLRYLFIEWRTIFPRNPVPRTFALVLIGIVTASQLYFGLHYALVAWPHSNTTRSVYVLK